MYSCAAVRHEREVLYSVLYMEWTRTVQYTVCIAESHRSIARTAIHRWPLKPRVCSDWVAFSYVQSKWRAVIAAYKQYCTVHVRVRAESALENALVDPDTGTSNLSCAGAIACPEGWCLAARAGLRSCPVILFRYQLKWPVLTSETVKVTGLETVGILRGKLLDGDGQDGLAF